MHHAIEEVEEGHRSLPKLEKVPPPIAESDLGRHFCSIKGVRPFATPPIRGCEHDLEHPHVASVDGYVLEENLEGPSETQKCVSGTQKWLCLAALQVRVINEEFNYLYHKCGVLPHGICRGNSSSHNEVLTELFALSASDQGEEAILT